MRFLIDAQLPPALDRLLTEHGHLAEHVHDIGRGDASDRAVIISFMVTSVAARRAGLQPPVLRMWPGTARVFIARPPEEVWAFIRPAETTPMIQPTVRRGFTVSGTPAGVGEQQCFISDGPHGSLNASVVEVVEE